MKKSTILFILFIIITISLIILWIALKPFKQTETPFELRVSAFDGPYSALIFYTDYLDLFKDENLHISYSLFDSGVRCVENLINEEVDLATGAEFVGVSFFERDNNLRILSSIAEGDVIQIIYQDDVLLNSPQIKKIGLKKNSQADFFFQRYLVYNDLPRDGFDIIETEPVDMREKLSNKELDGIVVWEPFVYDILNTSETALKSESVQANQNFYFLLFSNNNIIQEKGEAIKLFISALIRAQRHKEKNEEEFREFLQERFNYSKEELENTVKKVSFSVALTQGLINAIEAEAQWNIMTGAFEEPSLPNYLRAIDETFLLTVAPEQVYLYH